MGIFWLAVLLASQGKLQAQCFPGSTRYTGTAADRYHLLRTYNSPSCTITLEYQGLGSEWDIQVLQQSNMGYCVQIAAISPLNAHLGHNRKVDLFRVLHEMRDDAGNTPISSTDQQVDLSVGYGITEYENK